MADLIAESELVDRGSAITTTDDAGPVTVGYGLGNGFGAPIHRWFFEHAHGTVPDDGLGVSDDRRIFLCGCRADVHSFPTVCNFPSRDDLLVASGNVPKIVTAMRVDWEV